MEYVHVPELKVMYKVYLYDGISDESRLPNHTLRKTCRFCGKAETDTTFRYKAHAISENLGNRLYCCVNECDECNAKFSEIENDVYRFNSIFLLVSNSMGKMEVRKIPSRNEIKKIQKDKKGIIFETDVPVKKKSEQVNASKSIALEGRCVDSFVPQNVYKCYCKYAISMMPDEFCEKFKSTVSWIFGKKSVIKNLPNVLVGDCVEQDQPRFALFLRDTNDANSPYCVAAITIADKIFSYIVPCDEFNADDVIRQKQFTTFKGLMNFVIPNNWNELNLSSPSKKRLQFNLDIQNVIIGKTAYIVDDYKE